MVVPFCLLGCQPGGELSGLLQPWGEGSQSSGHPALPRSHLQWSQSQWGSHWLPWISISNRLPYHRLPYQIPTLQPAPSPSPAGKYAAAEA